MGGGGGLRWGVGGGIACGDASWVSMVTSASGLAFPESALGLGPPSLGRSSYQEQTGTVVSCEPCGMRLAWERRCIVCGRSRRIPRSSPTKRICCRMAQLNCCRNGLQKGNGVHVAEGCFYTKASNCGQGHFGHIFERRHPSLTGLLRRRSRLLCSPERVRKRVVGFRRRSFCVKTPFCNTDPIAFCNPFLQQCSCPILQHRRFARRIPFGILLEVHTRCLDAPRRASCRTARS